mgnify:CR=1 FL=1
MKNYTITVNGNVYDVTVEENGASAPVAAPRKAAAAPAAKAAAPFSALPDAAAKSPAAPKQSVAASAVIAGIVGFSGQFRSKRSVGLLRIRT